LRTVLITGFNRFPGSPVNPSGLLATRLVGRRRPAFIGTRRIAHVFATRYNAVDHELPALLAREKPDIIVMLASPLARAGCGSRNVRTIALRYFRMLGAIARRRTPSLVTEARCTILFRLRVW